MASASRFVFRCAAIVALVLTATTASAAGNTYTLSVLPSAPPVTMHRIWIPLVDRVSRATGLDFRLKLYETMAEFEQDIWGTSAPDFIFSSPIQIVVAHQANGYVPLVRARRPVGVGLFVRNDSPVRNIDDLIGKKLSFVGNKNVCSVTMQHLLSKHNKTLSFEKEYSGSTRNVIINVLLGKTDAGSVFLPEMDMVSEESRSQLRKVAETPAMAPHPLSAHPRVPKPVMESVRKTVLGLAGTEPGAQLLKTLRLEDPVAADYDADYRALEEIDIKKLTDWGR